MAIINITSTEGLSKSSLIRLFRILNIIFVDGRPLFHNFTVSQFKPTIEIVINELQKLWELIASQSENFIFFVTPLLCLAVDIDVHGLAHHIYIEWSKKFSMLNWNTYGLINLDVCWPLINLLTFWLFFFLHKYLFL